MKKWKWETMTLTTDSGGTATKKLIEHCNKCKITPGHVMIIESVTPSAKEGGSITVMLYQ